MENPSEIELLYRTYKPVMLGVAYRMLGSVVDAEDIVQEVFLSFNTAALSNVRNIKAYLCKVVTNRCLDRLQSTSKQRDVYVGPWLPEPLVSDYCAPNPSQTYEDKELISTAYLLLLQQLSMVERAVFVLREALQFEYAEIADIVDKSPSNCRQIFHRAKRSLGLRRQADGSHSWGLSDLPEDSQIGETDRQTRNDISYALIHQFTEALTSGNIQALLNILSADVAVYSDGGGRVKAAIYPIRGFNRVSKYFAGILAKSSEYLAFRHAMVNGMPGIVTYDGHRVSSVISICVNNNRITDIYIVVNPYKLGHVT